MPTSTKAPASATLLPSLFGSPGLSEQPHPAISAVATGSFRLHGALRVAVVDVYVEGLVFSCLVNGTRVVPPMQRGERAIRFTDRRLEAEAYRVAVEAAADAERRGWA